jgi:REP element-mobilizing transposase RayT
MIRFHHHTTFTTFTNLNWLPLLENDQHKNFIIKALRTRVILEEVSVYGLVIMPNHIHLIWQLHDGIIRNDFQRDFLKYTAKCIIENMKEANDELLLKCSVTAPDRKIQIWERNSLHIEIYSEKILLQKLAYLHNNPISKKWRLTDQPEKYLWSSASFYETGVDPFGLLTHWRG